MKIENIPNGLFKITSGRYQEYIIYKLDDIVNFIQDNHGKIIRYNLIDAADDEKLIDYFDEDFCEEKCIPITIIQTEEDKSCLESIKIGCSVVCFEEDGIRVGNRKIDSKTVKDIYNQLFNKEN